MDFLQGCLQGAVPCLDALLVVVVKEICCLNLLLVLLLSPELPHVDVLRVVPEPVEIALELVAEECLASARKANHNEDMLDDLPLLGLFEPMGLRARLLV